MRSVQITIYLCLVLGLDTIVRAEDGPSDELIELFLKAVPIFPVFRARNPYIPIPSFNPGRISTNGTNGNRTFERLADCTTTRDGLQMSDFGTIVSPNYPKNYPPRMACEWVIEGPPGSKIHAVLFDMVTQPWTFTYFDYIVIAKDGNFDKVDTMAGDMNQMTPMVIQSTTNKLGIRFKSSQFLNFRGFKLQYVVVPGDDSPPAPPRPVYNGVCGRPMPMGGGVATAPEPVNPTVGPTSAPATLAPNEVVSAGPIEVGPSDKPVVNDSRIIGGAEAKRHTYPWMVALLIDGKQFCGGSLISDQYVLTAAHCTEKSNMITVLLGTHNIKANKSDEPNRQVMNVTRENIFTHPEYNGNTIMYDISILRLPEKITFTDAISPVCLPNRDHLPKAFVGETTTVTGWGKTADNARGVSPVLKETIVKIMPNSQAKIIFTELISGNNVCVSTTPQSSPCKGDSGGPLMVKYDHPSGPYFMQVGIVSFGSLTCERGVPVCFTRVTAFLDYVNKITGSNY